MTIFINKKELKGNKGIGYISEPDELEKQIVGTWCKPGIDHCFTDKESFEKAVRRNKETLQSGRYETFFTPRNYRFSTEAKNRKETLYFIFEDHTTRQTGRLRQQHREKGPLATIDEEARTHLFLSPRRYKFLKARLKRGRIPCLWPCELQIKYGKRHIEFASISDWHRSEGTVKMSTRKMSTRDLKRLIDSALGNILGIPPKAA